MKKILLTLLFVILIAPSLSQAWYIEGHYDAVECAICGKTVYVYQETSTEPYMPSLIAGGPICPGGGPICPGECGTNFFTLYKYVCGDCKLKHYKKFDKYIEAFFVNRRFENRELIEKHQEERRQKGVEDRKNKIIELERELEGLRK